MTVNHRSGASAPSSGSFFIFLGPFFVIIVVRVGYARECAPSKKVKEYRCELSTSKNVCDVIANSASCYGDGDVCDTEDAEKVVSCNEKTSKETLKKCTKAESGRLYWSSGGTRACASGCNADKTACAE